MIVSSRSKFGIKLYQVWYADKKISKNGIIQYHQSLYPVGKNIKEFRTLLTDLSKEQTQIWDGFSKNCRYEIRRAEREGITSHIFTGKEINLGILEEFCNIYDELWTSKGYGNIDKAGIIKELLQYAMAGQLAVSRASFGEDVIVYHTYILDEEHVRLYQSVSAFRSDNEELQKIIGMGNRFLHWKDIMHFKDNNKLWYDWGGAGIGDEVKNITKFKESFGGKERFFYHGEEVNGFLPKMAHEILKRKAAKRGD